MNRDASFPRKAVRVFAMMLAVAVAAHGEPSVDEAIKHLGDEDASVREAAERTLLQAGDSVLERCHRELKQDCQPEVRARLRMVCETIEKEQSEEARWKSRWYRVEHAGLPCGWLHQSASRVEHDGKQAWKFDEDLQLKPTHDEAVTQRREHQLLCLRDRNLTPLECRIFHRFPAPEGEAKAVYSRTNWTLEALTDDNPWEFQKGKPVSMVCRPTDDWIGIPEQASFFALERQADQEFISVRITGDETNWFDYEDNAFGFRKELDLEFCGRTHQVRKYRRRMVKGARTVWISADQGVVMARFPGYHLLQLDEMNAKATVPDLSAPHDSVPGNAQKALLAFQAALSSGKGVDAWNLMTESSRKMFEHAEGEAEFNELLKSPDDRLQETAKTRYGIGAAELRELSYHESVLRALEVAARTGEDSLGRWAKARFKYAELLKDTLRVVVIMDMGLEGDREEQLAFVRADDAWKLDQDALMQWWLEDSED